MVATMKGLQEHLHSLHEAFGRQACQDLRQLGAEPFAAALDSLDRTGSGTHRLAAARALSSRCFELLQQQGWPHPAYRCEVPQEQLTGCCANLQPSPIFSSCTMQGGLRYRAALGCRRAVRALPASSGARRAAWRSLRQRQPGACDTRRELQRHRRGADLLAGFGVRLQCCT